MPTRPQAASITEESFHSNSQLCWLVPLDLGQDGSSGCCPVWKQHYYCLCEYELTYLKHLTALPLSLCLCVAQALASIKSYTWRTHSPGPQHRTTSLHIHTLLYAHCDPKKSSFFCYYFSLRCHFLLLSSLMLFYFIFLWLPTFPLTSHTHYLFMVMNMWKSPFIGYAVPYSIKEWPFNGTDLDLYFLLLSCYLKTGSIIPVTDTYVNVLPLFTVSFYCWEKYI